MLPNEQRLEPKKVKFKICTGPNAIYTFFFWSYFFMQKKQILQKKQIFSLCTRLQLSTSFLHETNLVQTAFEAAHFMNFGFIHCLIFTVYYKRNLIKFFFLKGCSFQKIYLSESRAELGIGLAKTHYER